MKIKLLKHILVGDADVMVTKRGEVVDVPDAQGKDFIEAGHAEEWDGKQAPALENKMVDELTKSTKKAK
ncbi:MAG: hypothetical protein ACRYGK_01725 [Janthinobacterium lividum]